MSLQEKIMEQFLSMSVEYAPRIAGALVVVIVGFWIVKKIAQMAARSMERSKVGKDIQPFLISLIGAILKILVCFSAASILGIEVSSFVAVLAAAGFAIGLALQGSLGNFAAGILILLFRPYKVGDLIEIQDNRGYVLEIQIFNTTIRTDDNKTVIIPNSLLINDKVRNLSTLEILRVEITMPVAYEENLERLQTILSEVLRNTNKTLPDAKIFVGIKEFQANNMLLVAQTYAKTDDYWEVYFELSKNIKLALHQNKVRIAHPDGLQIGTF